MTNIINQPHRPSDNPNTNFVPPAPKPTAPTVAQPIQIIHEDGQQFPVQVAEINKTSAVDRAKGFTIKTNQLSMVTAALATVAALVLGVRGFLLVSLVALIGYSGVWLAAFIIENRTSPGGIARTVALAKLSESKRHSRDYSDAYRAAQGLAPLSKWERLVQRWL